MNKNQITMAAIGGVALVAVGVVGYLAYAAWAEKGEKAEDLESAVANARRINAAAIAPKQESVDAIAANAQKLEEWRAEMLALVSAGDIAAILLIAVVGVMINAAVSLAKERLDIRQARNY